MKVILIPYNSLRMGLLIWTRERHKHSIFNIKCEEFKIYFSCKRKTKKLCDIRWQNFKDCKKIHFFTHPKVYIFSNILKEWLLNSKTICKNTVYVCLSYDCSFKAQRIAWKSLEILVFVDVLITKLLSSEVRVIYISIEIL